MATNVASSLTKIVTLDEEREDHGSDDHHLEILLVKEEWAATKLSLESDTHTRFTYYAKIFSTYIKCIFVTCTAHKRGGPQFRGTKKKQIRKKPVAHM